MSAEYKKRDQSRANVIYIKEQCQTAIRTCCGDETLTSNASYDDVTKANMFEARRILDHIGATIDNPHGNPQIHHVDWQPHDRREARELLNKAWSRFKEAQKSVGFIHKHRVLISISNAKVLYDDLFEPHKADNAPYRVKTGEVYNELERAKGLLNIAYMTKGYREQTYSKIDTLWKWTQDVAKQRHEAWERRQQQITERDRERERNHHEWRAKQEAFAQKLDDNIENQESFIGRLEDQISDLEDKKYNASANYRAKLDSWIAEKQAKIAEVREQIEETEDKLDEVRKQLEDDKY